jgi:hypothetical protein
VSRQEALLAFGLDVVQLRKSAQRLAVLASCICSTTNAGSLRKTEKYRTGRVALTVPSVGKSLAGSITVAAEPIGADMLIRCATDCVERLSAAIATTLVACVLVVPPLQFFFFSTEKS